MTKPEHLWAIGYDDMGRAEQVRDEIISLGWDTHYLDLLDVAVVVRHPDGSFTCNREPFPAVANILVQPGGKKGPFCIRPAWAIMTPDTQTTLLPRRGVGYARP